MLISSGIQIPDQRYLLQHLLRHSIYNNVRSRMSGFLQVLCSYSQHKTLHFMSISNSYYEHTPEGIAIKKPVIIYFPLKIRYKYRPMLFLQQLDD